MIALARTDPYAPRGAGLALETVAAWALALVWILPLAYAVWTAFHAPEFSTRFSLTAPLTLDNFARAWAAAPFARYFLNTFALVTLVLGCQLVLCTLAAYAFARYRFVGSDVAFALVLAQLMIMPDVLIVENYRTMGRIGILDSIPAIALPYVASAFGIFLLRQTFKTVPKELVTNSVEARPLTVGLQVFASTDQGIDWSVICAATLMTSGPLLLGFLLFQRQFVQSFMRAGIR